MEKEYNSMYFPKEDIEKGLMQDFIAFLCRYSYASDSEIYIDIHIRPDDLGAFIIEWAQVPWSHEYGGGFEYVGEEQEVVDMEAWLEENPEAKVSDECHFEQESFF